MLRRPAPRHERPLAAPSGGRSVRPRAAAALLALLLLAGLAPVGAFATEDAPHAPGPSRSASGDEVPAADDAPSSDDAPAGDGTPEPTDGAPQGPGSDATPDPEPDPEEVAELLGTAEAQGTVRVIVMLRDVPTARGAVGTASHRAAIARARTTVLERLPSRRGASGAPLAPSAAEAARGLRAFELTPGFALDVTPDELEALLADPAVASVTEDGVVVPLLAGSGPRIGRVAVGPYAGTFNGHTGTGWAVAILDSGVNRGHFALRGGPGVIHEACFSTNSFAYQLRSLCGNGTSTQIGRGAAPDCPMTLARCGHGTHVASTAAAMDHRVSSTVRLRSVAHRSPIVAVQVFSEDRAGGPILGTSSDIVAGMEHLYLTRNALGRPLAAVNLSLGTSTTYGPAQQADCDALVPAFTTAAANLRAAGIAVIAASGNYGATDGLSGAIDGLSWPACVSNVISVGSTRSNDTFSTFTNSSAALDLVAPGQSITAAHQSTGRTASIGTLSGTSMAAPHVAGAFAVLREAAPGATVTELLTLLQDTGVEVTRPGSWTGPRIDLAAAVAEVATANPPTRPSLGVRRGLLQARWSAPARGPVIVTGHEVQVQAQGDTEWRTVCGPLTATQRSCVVPAEDIDPASWGLTHTVRVRALSDFGPSTWVTLGSATPFTVPDPSAATLGVSTAPGSIAVAWSGVAVRAVEQGSAVRQVQVRATPTSGRSRARSCSAKAGRGGLPSACTISKLASGIPHTVEVRMRNASGWSAWTTVPGGSISPG